MQRGPQLSTQEPKTAKARPDNLAERVYRQLKQEIFEFRLLPGDRFSEGELAQRLAASRTPIRLALYRLQREGYLEVYFRSGWQVKPFDFRYFEELYDVRIALELAAVKRLCDTEDEPAPALETLGELWLVKEADRSTDDRALAELDEAFHCGLVAASGNREMGRLHREVTEKIRIVRRLDFTCPSRIGATYQEHGAILRAIVLRRHEEAAHLLKAHIELSRAEVSKITLQRLHDARQHLVKSAR